MSITKPELVLLDLDGTLVDSIPDLAYSVNQTLSQLNIEQREENTIRSWVGNGIEKLMHRAISNDMDGIADEETFNKAMDIFMEVYAENVCRLSDCYPGVREGIAALFDDNITLGVVTNKRGQFVGPILEKLGIHKEMSIIIGGDTLPAKKPDPLPLLHAAEKFNVSPERALMVGDSESDVKAARAAAFQIVCVSYGYNHGRDIREMAPDAVIDSLTELPALFG